MYFRESILKGSVILLMMCSCSGKPTVREGLIDHYPDFSSNYVVSRNVEVFLPPEYSPDEKYDVLYMHDGQNVFNPHTSYAGVAWEADKALVKLLNEGKIRPAIIVAIWNSPHRLAEYMPNMPAGKIQEALLAHGATDEILSDRYLAFLVEELKPFIDSTYSTKAGPAHTHIMGSSMGGLISFYALACYPEVFGSAACVSTHWPALEGIFVDEVEGLLPSTGNHRIYFDYGTATLDSLYEPFQLRVDSIMVNAGYVKNENWITLRFDGAEHSEVAWKERVHIPLEFLLRKDIND